MITFRGLISKLSNPPDAGTMTQTISKSGNDHHQRWRGRLEDDLLVRGLGQFTDDQRIECAKAVFLRSPHAHASIKTLDVSESSKIAGVLAIYTGKDFAPSDFGTVTRSAPLRD